MGVAGDARARVAPRPQAEAGPWRHVWGRRLLPYALIAPAFLVILGVLGYPLGMLLWLSTQHYGLRELIQHQGEFIGLQNFQTFRIDPQFRYVLSVSLIFTVVNVGLSMLFATGIALLLERVSRTVRILLSAGLVLVWATPSIPAIDLWQWMFDYEFGVVNWLLTHLGAGNYIHHNWFENPIQGFTVITVIVVWGAIPFLALMIYAGLTQVPRELVEAAEIDGARPWQVFRVSQVVLGSAAAVVTIAILVVVTFAYVRQTVRLTEEAV